MNTVKQPEEMNLKEFFEWFRDEYENNFSSENANSTINFLEGLAVLFPEKDRWHIEQCISVLRDAKNMYDVMKRYAK